MSDTKDELISAGNVAKELGISDAEVKKAINELGLKPAAKKGVCSYYARDTVDRVNDRLLP